MHTCVSKVTIIGSDNGLSPSQCQVIIWTNAAILSIKPYGTYFSEIVVKIQKFPFKEIHFNMSFVKWQPFCLSLNMLTLNLWGSSYLSLTRSISLLLMSWRRKEPVISSHDIDYVEWVGHFLIWGRISTTCVISMWRDNMNVNICFMFPLEKISM